MSEQRPETGPLLPKSVYLDTQFAFAYLVAEDQDHRDATAVAQQMKALVRAGSARAFVSVLVLDELAWKLGGVLHDRDPGNAPAWRQLSDSNKGSEYRRRRAEIAGWLRRLLLEPWISVLPADAEVCHRACDAIEEYGLRPADACHLACAVRHGVQAVLTNDRHFADLAEPPLQIVTYRGAAGAPSQ